MKLGLGQTKLGLRGQMKLGLRGQCETGLGPDKLGLGLDKARLRG